uniref:DUF5678 domain-containing protein n=1 Tax=viral metagenome TaxID=1070528 RepID=A0A6M3X6X6_9ZZZZ
MIGLSKSAIATAEEEFNKLRYILQKKFPNHYVVIDPYSKAYFTGPTLGEAMRTAKNKYPEKEFVCFKLDSDTALTFK